MKPVEQQVLSCDVCGTDLRVPGYGAQFGTLHARWGYGAQHDGEHYCVHLCEMCFFQAVGNLRRQHQVFALFAEGPIGDEAAFEPRLRNDSFGDR